MPEQSSNTPESSESQKPSAMAYWSVASSLAGQGRWAEAADILRQATQVAPNNAAIWSDLGVAEQYRGDLKAAAVAYEHSLSLAPQNPNTAANYSFLLVQLGQPGQAIALLKPLLDSADATALVWTAAGHAYRALGDEANAVIAFRQAVTLAPNDIETRNNLAVALKAASRLAEAKAATCEVLSADPNHAEAWHTLGGIAQAQGHMDEAIAAFRRSVELRPQASRHSSFLLAMQYVEAIEPAALLATHRQWDAVYAQSVHRLPPPSFSTGTDRKLRIGFVSSQFGLHPVGFFALRAIECLDKSRCTVACYSGRSAEDEYTSRFRAAADIWRTTTQLSAEQLAAQIRADEIDVLIDLMGHTSPALLAFAYCPAPLQISWLGYVGTTGLSAMDCLLADAYHVRPGEEVFYSEQILRMPYGYACYGPPNDSPEVNELPALKSGSVTFGCFNNPAKFSPGIVQAWAEILRRVPGSRLLLKYFGLDDGETQRRLVAQFAAANVDPTRVTFEGGADHAEMLASYHRVDLALDTQPYSGGLTTCEALWMGVPVVTYRGKTFAGRHSTSYLINAGFGKFVADDRTSYIDLAVAWANRLEELSAVRTGMRERMRLSPLCDSPGFAEDFLQVLRAAWLQRANTNQP